MPRIQSAALPIADLVVVVLNVINWLSGVAILVLLLATFAAHEWTLTALGILPVSSIRSVLMGLQAVAVLGLVAVPLNHAVLTRLHAMIGTVDAGDPFVTVNAQRLQTIAWALLALQVISVAIGLIGNALSTAARPIDLDAGFSTTGWLAVLLTFVLARVFADGSAMRADLHGTV